MTYDYLIVGAGFFGSICAYELNKCGFKVCIIDKRNHIGGNCYTQNKNNINIHVYGPHIFHTSNKKIWNWINQFSEFNNFTFRPVANFNGEIYSLPFNMWTFNKLFNESCPQKIKNIIKKESAIIKNEPSNLEEQAIKLVGTTIYQKLIKGYTEKQWIKSANQLPKEIIKRLPVRYTYDNNYFNDIYQGIPINGYTQIFEKLLEGIDLKLNVDYFSDELPKYKKLIYTGPIDRFFNYAYGPLEYKTLKFKHKFLKTNNFQGTSVMNYTSPNIPYTRIIEHKHFEFYNDINQIENTWITYEYPKKYIVNKTDPYYPVNDITNNEIYKKYKILSEQIKDKVLFGGRLAEYKYYDMDDVIESSFNFLNQHI
jgi:UDP-galactopyranose mutase